MKPKKDIFDLFRESEHKLAQRPSRNAWDRLESRLDEHKKRNRMSIIRILAYAAGVLVLVVSFSALSGLLVMADREGNIVNTPQIETEDVVVVNISKENFRQVEAYQRSYKDRLANPIAEGEATKKLIPKVNRDRRDGNLKSFMAKKQRENNQNIALNQKQDISNKDNNEKTKMETEPALIAENTTAGTHPDPVIAEETEPVAFSVPAPSARTEATDMGLEEPTAEADRIETEADQAPPTEEEIQEAFMRGEQLGKERTRKKEQKAASSKPASKTGQFNWLIGEWAGKAKHRETVDKWKKAGSDTYQGERFLLMKELEGFEGVAEGLMDEMQIQKIDGEWFFIALPFEWNQEFNCRLISFDGNEALFENQDSRSPKQVILRKKNNGEISITYKILSDNPNLKKSETRHLKLIKR